MPSGEAVKPGDVVQASNGKYIEIINTDAEGRLVLADVLAYRRPHSPPAVIDAATLTGACVIALGHTATGCHGQRRRIGAGSARRGQAVGRAGVAVAAVGRLQGADQVRRRGHQELGRTPGGDDHRGDVPARSLPKAIHGCTSTSRARRTPNRISARCRAGRPACRWERSSNSCEGEHADAPRARTVAASCARFGCSASAWWPGPFCTRRSPRRARCATRSEEARHDARGADPAAPRLAAQRQPRQDCDSLQRADSIKAAPTRSRRRSRTPSCRPYSASAGGCYWNRDSVFATGALTVADLLERVPGFTALHAGWIAAPAVGAYMGDVRRVRVFYDGFEYTPLDPRSDGVLDLTQINLWSVEDALDRADGGRDSRLSPQLARARHDSGDANRRRRPAIKQTNLYRGFFGTRFDNGGVVQFGAQQYGTTPPRVARHEQRPDRTHRAARVGEDASTASTRSRRASGDIADTIIGITPFGIAGRFDPRRRVDANRLVSPRRVGDPDTSAMWAQVMSVASKYDYTGVRTLPLVPNPMTPQDSAINNHVARHDGVSHTVHRDRPA